MAKPSMKKYETSAADKRADKKKGVKEGSKADMKADRGGFKPFKKKGR